MKLLLLQLMLFVFTTLTAQPITGIGPFTIGSTTTAVNDSLKKAGYTFATSPDWPNMVQPKNTRSIILLTPEATGFIRNSQTKPTEGLAVYNVGTIESRNVKVNNLILSFYKGILCSIFSNYYPTDFTQSVKKRLGAPTDSIHTTTAGCINYKNLVIADTISTYMSKPDIRIFEARGFYYDRQCNKKQKRFFEISNPVVMKRLSKSSSSFDLIFPYLFL